MFMSEDNTWSRIRLASSVALGFSDMLGEARDKEEELKLQLEQRKLEKKSMKRKHEMKQCKEYNDDEIKQIMQKCKEYKDKLDSAEAFLNSLDALQTNPEIEWDSTPLYVKFMSEYAEYTLKFEECTHALALLNEECTHAVALQKEEIKACKKRLKLQKEQVRILRYKRDRAKAKVKSLLFSFRGTSYIKIMSVDDLALLRALVNMKPTKPFKFTLGSSIDNAMGLAIEEIAHEMGLPDLRSDSLYEWDGVSCKNVGPE